MTYLTLPKVVSAQMRGLNCVSYAHSPEAYLKADTSVDCNSDAHQEFIVIDCLLILGYQLVPVLYIYVLYSNRAKLNPGDLPSEVEKLRQRDLDRSLDPYRFLFQDLKPDRWYHEVVRR